MKTKEKKRKFALALSGGGFLGAVQVGAINYIKENWQKLTGLTTPMKFDIIAGESVGSINGSMVATNQLQLLTELWLKKIAKYGVSEIYTSDFIDTQDKGDKLKMKLDLVNLQKRLLPDLKIDVSFFEKIGSVFSKQKRKQVIEKIIKNVQEQLASGINNFKSIADNSPLKNKLTQYLSKDKFDTEFICGFVSLDSGNYNSVTHTEFVSDEDLVNGILASTSIPIVWNPVPQVNYKKENNLISSNSNVDGGVINISPLGDVVNRIQNDKESEYTIIVINCHNGKNLQKDFSDKNIAQIAERSLYEIAFAEIFRNDVSHFLKINNLVKQAKAWDYEIELYNDGKELKEYNTIIIQPEDDVDLGNSLVANEKLIVDRYKHGWKVAKKAIIKFLEGGKSWK